jgi:hypothetical protein
LVRLLSLVCVLAGAAPAAEPDGGLAPPFQLSVRLSPEKVKLGEPTTLEVLVAHEPGQRYELKTPGDLGDFDYLGQERSRVDGADRSTTTLKIKLSAFQLGQLDTPNLELEVTSPDGVVTLPVPRAKLEVVSSLPADAQTKGANLYDVKPPEEVPVRTWRLLYILAGLLALAALGYLINKYLQRPRPVAVVNLPPPEPLHVRATKALDALAAENLPGKGEFKPYYFRLSEIVRGYLGELYGFEALESTTPELLTALRARTTPGLPMNDLVAFAESSDFVRYAKQEPSLEQCKADLELAYRIVHSTQAAAAPPRAAP